MHDDIMHFTLTERKKDKMRNKLAHLLFTTVSISVLIGCITEVGTDNTTHTEPPLTTTKVAPQIKEGILKLEDDQEINIEFEERSNGDLVFEGDILLDPETIENSGGLSKISSGVIFSKSKKWPSNTMYYDMGSIKSSSKRKRISDAIKHWNSHTKTTDFRLVKRNKEKYYVKFVEPKDDVCESYIGYLKKAAQKISIGNSCTTGAVIHEIGHAAGLYHEHSRSDRDRYVNIFKQNIIKGKEHNFNKWKSGTGQPVGGYDFSSIMHYNSWQFCKLKDDGSCQGLTIRKKDGSVIIPNTDKLSPGDIHGIKSKYNKASNHVKSYKWTTGWTTTQAFSTTKGKFLFILKKGTGDFHIHKINSDGTVGTKVVDKDWSSGYTTARFYTISGNTYMFMYKSGNGRALIYRINTNGTLGSKLMDSHWDKGWNDIEVFEQGRTHFLSRYNKSSGKYRISKFNSNGTVGKIIYDSNWGKSWTDIEFVSFKNLGGVKTFLYRVKNGALESWRINNDGTVGRKVNGVSDVVGTWTQLKDYYVDGKRFFMLYKSSTGTVGFYEVNSNGAIGKMRYFNSYSKGWNDATFYQTSKGTFSFMSKTSGTMHVDKFRK